MRSQNPVDRESCRELSGERGAAMVEYMLLIALIVMSLISSISFVTLGAEDQFTEVSLNIRNAVSGNPNGPP